LPYQKAGEFSAYYLVPAPVKMDVVLQIGRFRFCAQRRQYIQSRHFLCRQICLYPLDKRDWPVRWPKIAIAKPLEIRPISF
jgi:hypothetical protein